MLNDSYEESGYFEATDYKGPGFFHADDAMYDCAHINEWRELH